MNEEQTEQSNNLGSSLMSALFEKVDTTDTQEQPQEEQPQEEQQQPQEENGELSVYGLSDAIDMASTAKAPQPDEEKVEAVEEKPEVESLTKLDKALFKDTEPQVAEAEPEPHSEPEPEPEPEKEDLSWLTSEQKKRIELVEFAEENFDDYKGKKNQYIQFFKEQKEYLDTRLQEDPNAALDDSDFEYQNFLKRKKPKFTQDDLERVVELRTRKRAKEEAMNELKPELEAIKTEQKRQQIKPKVDALKEKTMSDVRDMVPDFLKTTIDSEGAKAAYENNPVEFDIVDRIVTTHQKTMFAFHEISNGLISYNPADRDHVRLAGFIDQLEASMPDKDGKKFVNIAEYQEMSPKDKNAHYTITHDEIVDYANKSAKKYIAQELNAMEAKLRKSGYTKTNRQPVANQQAPAPKPVKPQPRQGPNVSTPVASDQDNKNPVLSALGL